MKAIRVLTGVLLAGAVIVAVYETREAHRAQAALRVCTEELAKVHDRDAQRDSRRSDGAADATAGQNRVSISAQTPSPARPVAAAVPPDMARGTETQPAPRPVAETAELQRRKAAMHRRYDAFFRERGLTPAQGNRFVELMIKQENARADLQTAVLKEGVAGDDSVVEAERSQLYQPITQGLHDLLGNDGYAAYVEYERTSYYRSAFVQPMISSFSAAGAVLNDAQLEQLVRVVAANDHPVRTAPSNIGSESRIDWDSVVAQTAGVLNPAQMSVLQSWANLQKESRQDDGR